MFTKYIRLAIVDDHLLVRKTLVSFLSDQINIQVVAQASDVDELFSKFKTSLPEVLLMDMFMPHMNGKEAVKMIRNQYPSVKILILSMSQDVDMICNLLETGVHGYISKADEPDCLLQAIVAASEGRIHRNKLFTEALYRNKQTSIGQYDGQVHISLSEREKRILQLIWEEKSNKEIADSLFLGTRSVEKIRQDMKEKIGASSTVGLLKYALSQRIVDINHQGSALSI